MSSRWQWLMAGCGVVCMLLGGCTGYQYRGSAHPPANILAPVANALMGGCPGGRTPNGYCCRRGCACGNACISCGYVCYQ